jgi:hypothetical protein
MEKKLTDGSDLIFAAGAPGSKWSRVLSILAHHKDINASDKDMFPTYQTKVSFHGHEKTVGMHSSAYFGPSHGIGEYFNDLSNHNKEEFLEEIKKAFKNFDNGYKIIKCHWFSYNLDWLKANFPKAKIIMVYNGDEEAFKWWHLVGGWNIKFPYYDWYENDQKLFKHIKIENRLIFEFMKKNKLSFSIKDFKQLVDSLDLQDDLKFYDSMFEEDAEYFIGRKGFKKYGIGTTIAVYNPDVQTNSNLDDLLPSINTKIADKHNEWRIDEVLIDLYDKDWLDKIHAIIEGEKINEN